MIRLNAHVFYDQFRPRKSFYRTANKDSTAIFNINRVPSIRRARRPGPLTAAFALHFVLLKIWFFEYYVTTRQQTVMEKGIITFKLASRLKFSRFFVKFLATNCCTLM